MLRVNVVEPELNVPVTVKVYVPAGVPVPPWLPPPPPPQEDKPTSEKSRHPKRTPLSSQTVRLRDWIVQRQSNASIVKTAAVNQ